MKPWKITSFTGVNNVLDATALEQPDLDQYGRSGSGPCALVRCVNFDIDDKGGLIQRDDDQDIFSASYDAKLSQSFAGRQWTVDGSKLFYTLPFRADIDPTRGSIAYPAPIILIQEVEDGMWVSTTKRAGTGEKIHSSKLGLDSDGFVAVFATTQGICFGNKSGLLTNISEGIYSYKVGQRGISAIKEENGMVQYLVKMINQGDSYNPVERKVDIAVDNI
jgi:hypothetical protein